MISYEVCKACRDNVGWAAFDELHKKGQWYCPHEDYWDLINITDEDPPPGCIHKLEQAVAAGLRNKYEP
jgi:hypothetical protein